MDPMESWLVLMLSVFIFVVGYPMWAALLTFEEAETMEAQASPEPVNVPSDPVVSKHSFLAESSDA